jgi:hypothetical protein
VLLVVKVQCRSDAELLATTRIAEVIGLALVYD